MVDLKKLKQFNKRLEEFIINSEGNPPAKTYDEESVMFNALEMKMGIGCTVFIKAFDKESHDYNKKRLLPKEPSIFPTDSFEEDHFPKPPKKHLDCLFIQDLQTPLKQYQQSFMNALAENLYSQNFALKTTDVIFEYGYIDNRNEIVVKAKNVTEEIKKFFSCVWD